MHVRRKLLPLLLVGIALVICYIPWIFIVIKVAGTASNNYFLPPATPTWVFHFISAIFSNNALVTAENFSFRPFRNLSFILMGIFALSLLIFIRQKRKNQFVSELLILGMLFSTSLIAYSILFRNVLLPRYAIFAIIPLFFFSATQTQYIKSHAARLLLVFLLAGTVTYNTATSIRCRIHSNLLFHYYHNAIARHITPNDVIFIKNEQNSQNLRLIYAYLFPQNKNMYENIICPTPDGLGDDAHYARVYNANFTKITRNTDWGIFSNSNAYVFVINLANEPERFEKTVGEHATRLCGIGDAHVFLYRISPASKLRAIFEHEAGRR